MPYNGSGTFTLPAGNPVVTGTTISSTTTNNTNTDIANGLSNAVTRNGQSPPTANLPMASHKLTGLSAGTTAGDSVEYGGSPSFTNLTYTGTLTGSTGILNIGSGQLYKDASGNVGIGTSVPSAYNGKLVVAGTNSIQVFRVDESTSGYIYTQGVDNTGIYYSNNSAARGYRWINSTSTTPLELMRIDTSGNVGIGTSSPTALLTTGTLVDTTPATYGSTIKIASATQTSINSVGGIELNVTSGYSTKIQALSASGAALTFSGRQNNATWSEYMRIDSLGNVTLQENISVGAAAPTTSGNGITFPATQSASTDANTLDDYEEGVWTPVLTFATNGTMTYTTSTASGVYTKIGNIVTCKIALTLSAFTIGTASGQARISLPFTSAQNYFSASIHGSGFTTLFPNLALTVGSASYAQLYGNSAINTTPASVTPTNFSATSQVLFSITYTV